MARALRLYLDHSDLCTMADGKAAPHDDELRVAIAETGTLVLYSIAHMFDLVESDGPTIDRWKHAVEGLGAAHWIVLTDGEPVIKPFASHEVDIFLAELRSVWPPAKRMIQDLTLAGYEASRPAVKAADDLAEHGPPQQQRPPRKRELRELFDRLLSGDTTLANEWAKHGLDAAAIRKSIEEGMALYRQSPDEAFAAAFGDPADALAAGDVAEVVCRRTRANRGSRPLASDPTDRQHLEFLPFVDVFTADRYVCAQIDKRITRAVVTRAAHLDEVALHLRHAHAARGVP